MTAAVAIATLAGVGYVIFVFWVRALYRECRELRQLNAAQDEQLETTQDQLEDAITAYGALWEEFFNRYVQGQGSAVVRINAPVARGKN